MKKIMWILLTFSSIVYASCPYHCDYSDASDPAASSPGKCLYKSAAKGNLKKVAAILLQNPLLLNHLHESWKLSALQAACEARHPLGKVIDAKKTAKGRLSVVRFLLKHEHINVNMATPTSPFTPLFYACRTAAQTKSPDDFQIIRELLAKQALINWNKLTKEAQAYLLADIQQSPLLKELIESQIQYPPIP